MLNSLRTRILAVFAALVVVAAGIAVPIAASAVPLYPAQAPGSLALVQLDTGTIAANADGFPDGATATKVQWLRGSTVVSTGTTFVYTLVPADQNQLIKARLTFVVPGFAPTVRDSPAGNFSFTRSGLLTISGAAQVGASLTVSDGMTFADPSGTVQAPSRSYQWLRNGIASGPPEGTPVPFEVQPVDFGATISLRVTVVNYGIVPQTITSPAMKITLKSAIAASGAAVAVAKSVTGPTITLTAGPASGVTESGTTTSYQWYRQAVSTNVVTAIAGKVGATYVLTQADYPYRVFVRATVTKPDRATLVLESTHKDYSVRIASLALSTSGNTYTVGGYIGPQDFTTSIEDEATTDRTELATPSFSWYRSGVLIAGLSQISYRPVALDVGKTINFAVSMTSAGYLPMIAAKSPASPKITSGPVSLNLSKKPTITKSASLLLTANPTSGAALTSGAAVTAYQWLRAGVAIAGAKLATYQLVAADAGKSVSVTLTYGLAGYTSSTISSTPVLPTVVPSTALPVITGERSVGETLGVDARAYVDGFTGSTLGAPDVQYFWMRNGVGAGAGPAYVLTSGDKGKTISVRVTASSVGLFPSVTTSAASPAIGDLALDETQPNSTVGIDPASTAAVTKLLVTSTGVSGPAPLVVVYQWYRGNTAVVGQNKVGYTLTAADRGQQVWVRVTTTKVPVGGQTFTPSIKDSARKDYSITATTTGVLPTDEFKVGDGVYAVATISTSDGELSVYTDSYQWLRNGVAIAGATTTRNYTLQAADLGARISVRAAVSKPGYLPVTYTATTAPATAVVLRGDFTLGGNPVTIDTTVVGKLTANPPADVTPAPPSFTYQWLRGGVAIAGQTARTYTLASADAGTLVTVRVTPVRAGYLSAPLPLPTAIDYSLHPDVVRTITPSGSHKVGETLGVTAAQYDSTSSSPVTVQLAYQWYRNGVAIAGALASTYTLAVADLLTSTTVRVTATAPGQLAHVMTTAGTYTAALGHTSVNPDAVVTFDNATQSLKASIANMVPATPAPALTYQWFKNGVAIPNAKAAVYKPLPADFAAAFHVAMTVNRGPSFDNTISPIASGATYYSMFRGSSSDNLPVALSGTARVGELLSVVDPGGYFDRVGTLLTVTETFTWLRNGVAIAGSTGSTYRLVGADLGKTITAKVVTTSAGHFTYVSPVSAASNPVVPGTLPGSFTATVTMPTAGTLTAALVPSVGVAGDYVAQYQWYRGGFAVANQKAQTYKLTAADTGSPVVVRITVAKTGYITQPDAAIGLGNFLVAQADPFVGPTDLLHEGTIVGVATPPAFAAPGITAPSQYTVDYQWQRFDGTNWLNIQGAGVNSAIYEITADDLNHPLRVQLKARAPFSYAVPVYSNEVLAD